MILVFMTVLLNVFTKQGSTIPLYFFQTYFTVKPEAQLPYQELLQVSFFSIT